MSTAHRFVSAVTRYRPVLIAVFTTLVVVPLLAQNPGKALGDGGSVRGRVFDADTGELNTRELTISAVDLVGTSVRQMEIVGSFVFSDLSAGLYQLRIQERGARFPILASRNVQLTDGAVITSADIYLRLPGEINAVVADSAGEPIQGSVVMLVSSDYVGGHAAYTFTYQKTTDDRGHVNFSQVVEAGHPYFLLALPPEPAKPTSSTPGTRSVGASWYPARPGMSQPFVLRSAERRDIRLMMPETQTYCVEGRLMAEGLPAALDFEVAVPEVGGYVGLTGGTRGVVSRGKSDASGHFKVCGLWPGEFLLAAGLNEASYGRMTISIVDRDVREIALNARAPLSLSVEVSWDSPQITGKAFVLQFVPFSRAAFYNRDKPSELQPLFLSKRIVVPSRLTVSLPAFTDYVITGGGWPPSPTFETYFKEANCGGTISRNLIKLGDAPCNLYITVGTDKGKLSAIVIDRDNHPDSNSSVCVWSSSAVTREEIAESSTCSVVEDPRTGAVAISVSPGRYLAMTIPPGTSDSAEYILTNRGQGEAVEIRARSTSLLTLKSSRGR